MLAYFKARYFAAKHLAAGLFSGTGHDVAPLAPDVVGGGWRPGQSPFYEDRRRRREALLRRHAENEEARRLPSPDRRTVQPGPSPEELLAQEDEEAIELILLSLH